MSGVDITDGSVGGIDIQDGTVTGADIQDGTVTGTDITDESVTGADIQDGTVTGADISSTASLAVGSLQIGGGSTIKKMQCGMVTPSVGEYIGTVTFPTPFSSVPLIFLIAEAGETNRYATCVRVEYGTRTTTGFSWKTHSGTTPDEASVIFWMAIEQE